MIKTLMKRMLLFSVCFVGAMLVLAIGFTRGALSPRELGIALLVLCIAMFTSVVLIARKTAREWQPKIFPPAGTPIDPAAHKLLIWQMRAAKTMIALMAVGLVAGFNEVRNFSTWGSDKRLIGSALLVGLVMNLLTTTLSVKTLVRLRKKMDHSNFSGL
jgi:hypothetical protein